jgi:hypothetical protein
MLTRSTLRSTLAIALLLQTATARATITFIGEGDIPGTATDQSGLTKVLEDGVTPGNQVGGLGSAITYTGVDSLYVATPDRGPADGTTSYIDRIYTIRITATKGRRRGQEDLPHRHVTPVSKAPFLDLLDPTFGLAGASFPEKIEGLAFGPDLADGRHLLIVTNDNDFVPTQANRFFAFAIDRSDLPQFAPQQFGRRRDCSGHGHDGFGFD